MSLIFIPFPLRRKGGTKQKTKTNQTKTNQTKNQNTDTKEK